MARDLEARVEQRTGQRPGNGKAVELREDPRAATFRDLLRRQKPEIARALPGHMDADRLTRIGLTVFRQSTDLQKCDPLSILGALMTCGQLGMEPGPLGHAYLVPFKGQCTFVLGYKGMIELVRRTGQLARVTPGIVYQNELEQGRFEVWGGSDSRLYHKPIIFEDAGAAVGWYVIVKLTSGEEQFSVLARRGVEAFRAKSKQPNGFLWRDNYDMAALKTCMRRLFPWLPVSIELAQAITQDEQVRRDIAPDALDAVPELPAIEAPATTPATGQVAEAEVVSDDSGTLAGPGWPEPPEDAR